jgi:hypothetical protein
MAAWAARRADRTTGSLFGHDIAARSYRVRYEPIPRPVTDAARRAAESGPGRASKGLRCNPCAGSRPGRTRPCVFMLNAHASPSLKVGRSRSRQRSAPPASTGRWGKISVLLGARVPIFTVRHVNCHPADPSSPKPEERECVRWSLTQNGGADPAGCRDRGPRRSPQWCCRAKEKILATTRCAHTRGRYAVSSADHVDWYPAVK